MQSDAIEKEVRRFIIDTFLYGKPIDLAPDESLLDRGIIDSTGVLDLVGFLEERFSITVEDQEVIAGNLDSIRNLTAFVSRKLGPADEQSARESASSGQSLPRSKES